MMRRNGFKTLSLTTSFRSRNLHALIGLGLLVMSGCGDSGLSTDSGKDGSGGSHDAGVSAPSDLTMKANPDLTGLQNLSFTIGPISLAPGQERTVCTVFKLTTQAPIDVLQIDSKLLPGSHHLIFYKSNLTDEQTTPFDCQPLDIGFGGKMVKNIPVYISETQAQNALPLPSGVAYHFDAGQMVKIEAHYINATASMLTGKGTVSLTVAPVGQSLIPANIMFCGSVSQLYFTGVPPGMSQLTPGFFKPPTGTKVFGLTAHQHRRGSLMTISKSTGQQDEGQLLVNGTPWDNEPFVTYDDNHLLTFGPNEGLRWQCNYNNPDNQTIKFGESADSNEMCFLWAYYYPAADHFISQECIR